MKSLRVYGSLLCLAALTATALAATPIPLSPSGPITDRTPTYKWTDTGAAQFTVELTKDESKKLLFTVSAPKLTAPSKLPAAVYRWRVKEGPAGSASPWSASLSFSLLPNTPSTGSPVDSTYPSAPTAPTFKWLNIDPDANRFVIELYKNADRLDSMTVIDEGKYINTATWPDAMSAGVYEWRIRAMRKHANNALTVTSPWSKMARFSIGIPLPPTITSPMQNAVLSPGTYPLGFTWTTVAGAASYSVVIRCNNAPFEIETGLPGGSYAPNLNWGPGYYTVAVRAVNGYGNGGYSEPRLFRVTRNMDPDKESVLASVPSPFTWTRSNNATRYRLRLFKATPAAGGLYEQIHEAWINQSALSVVFFKTTSLGLTDGAYKWMITDFDGDTPLYTSTAYFSALVPGRPPAESPTRKKIAGLLGVEFTWSPAAGSPPTHYQFQLLKEGALIKDTGWQVPSEFTKFGGYHKTYNLSAYGAGAYEWRVRAKNVNGIGGWRQVHNQIAALEKPVNNSPASGSIALPATINFKWGRVPGATRYEIGLWEGDLQGPALIRPATSDAIQHYAWPISAGTYTFRIRALDIGAGPWSDPRTYSD